MPRANDHAREYVNLDALGRRIPWRRPAAPSLEEWVTWRENESSEQREERLKRGPHRRSEPTCNPVWRGEPHAPIVARRSTLTYQDPLPTSLGLSIADISRDPEPMTSFGEAEAPPGNVVVSRRRTVNGDASQNVIHMPFATPSDAPPDTTVPFQLNLRRRWLSPTPAGDAAPDTTRTPPAVALASDLHGQPREQDIFSRAAASSSMLPPVFHDTRPQPVSHPSHLATYGSRPSGLNRALEISRTVGDLLQEARQMSSNNSSLENTFGDTEATLDPSPLFNDRPISQLGPQLERRSPVPSSDFITQIQQLRNATQDLIADIHHSAQGLRGFDHRIPSGAQRSSRRLSFPAIDASLPTTESPPSTSWTYARAVQPQDGAPMYRTSSLDPGISGSRDALAISPSSPLPQRPQRLLEITGTTASHDHHGQGRVHSNVLNHEGRTEDRC